MHGAIVSSRSSLYINAIRSLPFQFAHLRSIADSIHRQQLERYVAEHDTIVQVDRCKSQSTDRISGFFEPVLYGDQLA